MQEYVYTRGAELDQFDLGSIHGIVFTCVVHIYYISAYFTQLLVQSSLIWFDSSTTVRGGTTRIEAVRFDLCLYYEWNCTSLNWFEFACWCKWAVNLTKHLYIWRVVYVPVRRGLGFMDYYNLWNVNHGFTVCAGKGGGGAEIWMHIFNALVTSAKCVLPPCKVFVSSTINSFVFFLEGGLETLEKEQKLGNKVSVKLHFS